MPPKRAPLPPGFSVIEMIVAVAILGIVLAVALPNFAGSNQQRAVELAATTLSSRLQAVRQRTVASRIPHRVVLDRAGQSYSFESLNDDDEWVRTPDEIYSLPPGVGWTVAAYSDDEVVAIEFEAQGTVLPEHAPLSIEFANPRGDRFSLSLVRTGRVAVQRFVPQ